MKTTVLHAAILSLLFPLSLNAIGLGTMKVESCLDQPFSAEIELLDVGSAPLTGIRVGVADPENFERIGLERIAILSLLNFKVEKNQQGKIVIKVQSLERMTEPYLELVVDLSWPKGQLYKTYTILLDPPGYQLASIKAQRTTPHYQTHSQEPGVIDKPVMTTVEHNPITAGESKKQASYGPTISNENVWQIAQRYKISDTILPQVVLAIIGSNPNAFKDGNLNGLKIGIRLVIPSTEDIKKVPADLATAEVMAHDKAWNENTSINHVLAPPYISTQANVNSDSLIPNSVIPAIPKFAVETIAPSVGMLPRIDPSNPVSVMNTNQQSIQNPKPANSEQDSNFKAELSITTSAIESVRESNALLMEQLHLVQEQNRKLQKQLDKRDKEMAQINAQLQKMMKQRLALASQQTSSASTNNDSFSLWPLWLLILLAAGGGVAYWYFKLREQGGSEPKTEPQLTPTPVILDKPEIASQGNELIPEEKPVLEPEEKPVLEPEEKPVLEPEEKPVLEPEEKPVLEPEEKPVLEPEEKPVLEPEEKPVLEPEEKPVLEPEEIIEPVKVEDSVELQPLIISEETTVVNKVESESSEPKPEITKAEETTSEPEVLEFESGLYQNIISQVSTKPVKKKVEKAKKDDNTMDFVSALASDQNLKPKEENQGNNLLKNNVAVDTLLALAKTYMGMDDMVAARSSLEEVLAVGTELQKKEAQDLLDEINGNSSNTSS